MNPLFTLVVKQLMKLLDWTINTAESGGVSITAVLERNVLQRVGGEHCVTTDGRDTQSITKQSSMCFLNE